MRNYELGPKVINKYMQLCEEFGVSYEKYDEVMIKL